MTMAPSQMNRVLEELKWSLQALALEADVQQTLFPSFAATADELALDFDNWRRAASGQHAFTAEQHSALAAVDALLDEMSGKPNAGLWTDAALAGHPQWQEVRQRASRALAAFGWKLEKPPSDRGTYIKG